MISGRGPDSLDGVAFHPYHTSKDLVIITVFLIVFAFVVFFVPDMGEPVQLQRRALGIRVIAFLLIFLVIAYMLKREIWRGVQ